MTCRTLSAIAASLLGFVVCPAFAGTEAVPVEQVPVTSHPIPTGAASAPEPPSPSPVPPSAPTLTPPKISGYAQPAYNWGPGEAGPASNFFIRRLRVSLNGEVFVPQLSYTVQVDFAAPQKLLRDGFLGLKYLPGEELRIGQFKVPFGWENPTADSTLPLIERTVMTGALAQGPDPRDLGIGLFGAIPLSGHLKLENGIAVVNGAGANNPENTPKKDAFGRLGLAYDQRFRVGVSAASVQFKPTADVRETSTRLGADVQLDVGRLFLVAEYIRGFYTEPTEQLRSGFQVTGVGKLHPHLDLAARYEHFTPDHGAPDTSERRLTVGVNFYFFRPHAKLMLNYRHDLARPAAPLLLAQLQYQF